MDKKSNMIIVENFLRYWQEEFPEFVLTADDLKNPHKVMSALLELLDRLLIDRDIILAPIPEAERNENTLYFWDLLPVLNMTRVVNHILTNEFNFNPDAGHVISIMHILQPTLFGTHSVLYLLFNFTLFYQARLQDLLPYEKEQLSKRDMVCKAEQRKDELLAIMNDQAAEKAKREDRMLQMEQDIMLLQTELQQEMEKKESLTKDMEAVKKENLQIDVTLEQKKMHLEALTAEIERKKALRVYDAEDVKAQAEQGVKNIKEQDEIIKNQEEKLSKKKDCLNNLQTIKHTLDKSNKILDELKMLYKDGKEDDDSEAEGKNSELSALQTELAGLEDLYKECKETRSGLLLMLDEAQAYRKQQRPIVQGLMRDLTDESIKLDAESKMDKKGIEKIHSLTDQYDVRKTEEMTLLQDIKTSFINELTSFEKMLFDAWTKTEQQITEKLNTKQQFV